MILVNVRLLNSTFLLFIITSVLIGCNSSSSSTNSTNPSPNINESTSKTPKLEPITIAVIPGNKPLEQEQALKPLADHLTQYLGTQVNFQIASDYNTAVTLLATEKVQMAYLGPFTYIQAKQLNPQIHPIVAPINKDTGRPWYTSVIVANSTKGIRTVGDLKGKRFGFVSESSTSGYLMPLSHFTKLGIVPKRDFALVKFSGSHAQVKADLESHVVDAIADDKPSYLDQQKAGRFDSKKYQIIWESSPIAQGPIVVLENKFSPEMIIQIKKAFVDASQGLVDVNGAPSAGYTLVQDEDYEPIRKLQEQLQLKSGQFK
jgi:phosphonate transport system substrate-binding protein